MERSHKSKPKYGRGEEHLTEHNEKHQDIPMVVEMPYPPPLAPYYQRLATKNVEIDIPNNSQKRQEQTRAPKIGAQATAFPQSEEYEDELEKKDRQYRRVVCTGRQAGYYRMDGTQRTNHIDDRGGFNRVTAYCMADSYKMVDVLSHFKKKWQSTGLTTIIYDEAIYIPINDHGAADAGFDESADLPHQSTERCAFVFEYGAVVCWGMAEQEERAFLAELRSHEKLPLEIEDIEKEEMLYKYDADHPSRIINDSVYIRSNNHLVKLSVSHALAQSVKLGTCEKKMSECIELTRPIPYALAKRGSIQLSRKEIGKMVGKLFVLKININLVSSALDTPDMFWSNPRLEPFYQVARNYMEISPRIGVLNQKCTVISDVLYMMWEEQGNRHELLLEWVVIVLIALEVLLGIFSFI